MFTLASNDAKLSLPFFKSSVVVASRYASFVRGGGGLF